MKSISWIFLVIFILLLLGLRALFKCIVNFVTDGEEKEVQKEKETQKGYVKRDFFVKTQTRRRRLNLGRKGDNILSGQTGKKLKRQRKGMFGK